MWHNLEYRKFTYVFFILLILFTIIMEVYVSMIGAMILFVCGLCLYLSCAVFTALRYRSIAQLSNYLQAVYNGRKTMDIRNHKEGELNVLKSEIYKITSILKQQSDTMHKEKIFLAEALSNISHQLKTPLTGMLVMSELLQDENLPQDKRKEFLAQIQTQLKRIEWLVTTLLKISKIDAQAIEFHKQPACLKTILTKAIEPISIPMEIKEITCDLHCDEQIFIQADENWCVEAFVNILKTAWNTRQRRVGYKSIVRTILYRQSFAFRILAVESMNRIYHIFLNVFIKVKMHPVIAQELVCLYPK